MLKNILMSVGMFSSMVLSKESKTIEYPVYSTTLCMYNTVNEEYDKNCKETTDDPGSLKIRVDQDNKILYYGNSEYPFIIIDVSTETLKSTNEIVIVYILHNKAGDRIVLVLGKSYVRFNYTNQYAKFYNVSNMSTKKKSDKAREESSEEGSYSSGSGFGITKRHVITNNHVTENMEGIMIVKDKKYFKAEVVFADPILDIAVLKTDSNVSSCSMDYEVRELGDDVIAWGFPNISFQGLSIKATKGIISSTKGFEDDIKTYQFDAAVQPGNSGGPITFNGKVVGVVVSRVTVDNAQNVNYAIKTTFLLPILKSLGIKPLGVSKPIDCTYMIFGKTK